MEGQNQGQGQTRGNQEGGIGSPISNEAYNILSALHNKLEGLEAYRKYSKDGDQEIWKEMSAADVKCVERLVDELERMVQDGKFRGEGMQQAKGGGGQQQQQQQKPRS